MPLKIQPLPADDPAMTAVEPDLTTKSPAASAWRRLLARMRGYMPGACALCARTGPHVLCHGCSGDYFGKLQQRCRCCALPLPGAVTMPALCGRCLRQAPAFEATVVAADYAAPIDRLVLELKFGNRLALATLFAERLQAAVADAISGNSDNDGLPMPTFLTAVPLGAQRLRQRGFNQALEIAKPLAAAFDIALVPRMLVRCRETDAQAQLSPAERHQNLRGAFSVAPEWVARLRGCHVGVVDDVMTTGQTLHEVAATLKRFGAARVTNLVFARTLPK